MSKRLSKKDLKVLFRRVDLTLEPEDLQWLVKAFNAYRQQMDALHRLPLDKEEVATAFMQAGRAQNEK
jgi:hypothetical protein